MKRSRKWLALAATVSILLTGCVAQTPAAGNGPATGSGGTLVVGLTASTIPPLDTVLTNSQGLEGKAFIGSMLYDGLTGLDLDQSTTNPKVVPSLATSWTAQKDATEWAFKLRPGVKFSDGTPWDADAALFNFARYLDDKNQYSSAALRSQVGLVLQGVKSYTKTDDLTVKIVMSAPDAHLPADLTSVFMASPTAVKKYGVGNFSEHPVGTGPFVFASQTTGQSLTLTPNKTYWGTQPKLDQLVLKPIADPAARVAALRSGSVNFINGAPPDDVPSLKDAGFQTEVNAYDQIWPWLLDLSQKPWNDVRVRQAANYAINRDAMVGSLLHGTADAAEQLLPHAMNGYEKADDVYSYNPAKAKQLLAEAGYAGGVDVSVAIPTSGSGNMLPVPMNEALQQDLAAVGIRVKLVPMDWATLLSSALGGTYPSNTTAMNLTFSMSQEPLWPILFDSKSPANLDHYANPQVDKLLAQAQRTVDDTARAAIYRQAGVLITKDAPWLFVVNDKNPRALAPTVHGFVQPRSWFVDLKNVWVS